LEALRERRQREVRAVLLDRLKALQTSEDVAAVDLSSAKAYIAHIHIPAYAAAALALVDKRPRDAAALNVRLDASLPVVQRILDASAVQPFHLAGGTLYCSGKGLRYFSQFEETANVFSIMCLDARGRPADFVTGADLLVRVVARPCAKVAWYLQRCTAADLKVTYRFMHGGRPVAAAEVRITVSAAGVATQTFVARGSGLAGIVRSLSGITNPLLSKVCQVAPDDSSLLSNADADSGMNVYSLRGLSCSPLFVEKPTWDKTTFRLTNHASVFQTLKGGSFMETGFPGADPLPRCVFNLGFEVAAFDVRGSILVATDARSSAVVVYDIAKREVMLLPDCGMQKVRCLKICQDGKRVVVHAGPDRLEHSWALSLDGSGSLLLRKSPYMYLMSPSVVLTPTDDLVCWLSDGTLGVVSTTNGDEMHSIAMHSLGPRPDHPACSSDRRIYFPHYDTVMW